MLTPPPSSLPSVRRRGEVRFLQKQKYLDAWCVFFWATTPVLMCLLTFGTYVLLGNRLTAATVRTRHCQGYIFCSSQTDLHDTSLPNHDITQTVLPVYIT